MKELKLQRRAYEERAIKQLRAQLKSDKRVVAVSPTGSGKTVIASLMIKKEPRWRKVLWLAHRHELVSQAYETLMNLGVDAGVLMAQDERLHGKERQDPSARVQVASVQTIASRGVPDDVDLIVFDDGAGLGSSHVGSGTSTRDLAERLRILYGRGDLLTSRAGAFPIGGRWRDPLFRN